MGNITIASRHSDEEIYWNSLEGGSIRQPDILDAYQVGDTVILEYEVGLASGAYLSQKKGSGLCISLNTDIEGKEDKYRVSLEFSVIKRFHDVRPDWMMSNFGLRASEHTIVVQAVSDEVEEVLAWMLKEELIS